MDAVWMLPVLLVFPLLLWTSSTFVYYFKKCFYVAYMMLLAVATIPMCILKSGGRDIENMRVIRFMVRHVKYFLGLRYQVSGWEHLQTEGPYVIISNHQSSLDVLGMMEILPDRCTMVAKKELVWAGTVGMICWLGGIVFINRQKTRDAKNVMSEAAKTMIADQIRLWVFPEGTRNQNGGLLPFKKGAFHLAIQAQAPIRSSRNPTCSLRESIRSSCCRECDRKLVLSDRKLLPSPTPSNGKSVVKGARTISSFYREREEETPC
ncbi:1-acyl-sn-glycerol-3-phosphate acyltransferase alpha [Pimephales promelas]|nr:1-acyl-sn-glycerol-3-phosphate acyltransferase alpha [Pimephales promelas]